MKSVSLMYLNNQYVRQGELDLHELFVVEDCTADVFAMLPDVAATVTELKTVADQDIEPDVVFGAQCNNPYECGYRGWCWRELLTPSVFDLNRMQMCKALGLRDKGILTFQDLLDHKVKLGPHQMAQVCCEVRDEETFQPAIPPFDGVKPYQQIPTQYSLHVLRTPDGELEYYEFLAEAGSDPRRAVAEHLTADIPAQVGEDGAWVVMGTTLAYNVGFEKGRIKEMVDAFPDLADRLLAINEGMDDLIKPFGSGAYYARAMGGSNSIKYVLPALFPDDPELDYHNLEGVHNGSEAMSVYAEMVDMGQEELVRTMENLLRYCELDTYAMVKIWQKLAEAVRDIEGAN